MRYENSVERASVYKISGFETGGGSLEREATAPGTKKQRVSSLLKCFVCSTSRKR